MKRQEKQEGFPGERLVVVPRPVVTMAMHQPLLKHLPPTVRAFIPRPRAINAPGSGDVPRRFSLARRTKNQGGLTAGLIQPKCQ